MVGFGVNTVESKKHGMTEIMMLDFTFARGELMLFDSDVLYILPPQDSKPIKVVYENSYPCPLNLQLTQQYRCEYSKFSYDGTEVTIECTNFENCPKFNP
jgi:hypothetical protein